MITPESYAGVAGMSGGGSASFLRPYKTPASTIPAISHDARNAQASHLNHGGSVGTLAPSSPRRNSWGRRLRSSSSESFPSAFGAGAAEGGAGAAGGGA